MIKESEQMLAPGWNNGADRGELTIDCKIPDQQFLDTHFDELASIDSVSRGRGDEEPERLEQPILQTDRRLVRMADIPRDKDGRIRWNELKRRDVELFCSAVRLETFEVYRESRKLSHSILRAKGKSPLSHAATNYLGGMERLKEDLGMVAGIDRPKPHGYWTDARIEEESRSFLQAEGKLSKKLMIKRGRLDLVAAIASYPGKFNQLEINLGLSFEEIGVRRKWSYELVLKEALEFCKENGSISETLLLQNKRGDLVRAIRVYYLGGLRQLRIDHRLLGPTVTRRPYLYWNPEKIRAEALAFYLQNGELSDESLKSANRRDLRAAIQRHYPGRMSRLRIDLGIQSDQIKEADEFFIRSMPERS